MWNKYPCEDTSIVWGLSSHPNSCSVPGKQQFLNIRSLYRFLELFCNLSGTFVGQLMVSSEPTQPKKPEYPQRGNFHRAGNAVSQSKLRRAQNSPRISAADPCPLPPQLPGCLCAEHLQRKQEARACQHYSLLTKQKVAGKSWRLLCGV